jgi:hypothetical protein
VDFLRFFGVMRMGIGAAYMAALLFGMTAAQAASAAFAPHGFAHPPPRIHTAAAAVAAKPWDEGVTPALENRLFDATYKTLPSHNVLKVYVFDTSGYESAGIRFSARVPHEQRDLTRPELDAEAASLIRTTFDQFPQLQTLDVWATIPIPTPELAQVESTVFSVSADRATYESVHDKPLNAEEFLALFGQVWVAPQVPQ